MREQSLAYWLDRISVSFKKKFNILASLCKLFSRVLEILKIVQKFHPRLLIFLGNMRLETTVVTNSVVVQIFQGNLDIKCSFLLPALIWDFNNVVVISVTHRSSYPFDTEKSKQIIGEKRGVAVGGVCRENGKEPRIGLSEKLNASRVHGIMDEKVWNKRRALRVSEGLALRLPGGCLGDRAAAACISQWVVLWMGRNPGTA